MSSNKERKPDSADPSGRNTRGRFGGFMGNAAFGLEPPESPPQLRAIINSHQHTFGREPDSTSRRGRVALVENEVCRPFGQARLMPSWKLNEASPAKAVSSHVTPSPVRPLAEAPIQTSTGLAERAQQGRSRSRGQSLKAGVIVTC